MADRAGASLFPSRPDVPAPMIVWDYVFALEGALMRSKKALIRCAELAGEDGESIEAARTGAMKFPEVEQFAVRAVTELRELYEGAIDGVA